MLSTFSPVSQVLYFLANRRKRIVYNETPTKGTIMKLIGHVALTFLTGGLWLVVLIIRKLIQ